MASLMFILMALAFILGVAVVFAAHEHKKKAIQGTEQKHQQLRAAAPSPTLAQTEAEVQGERDMIRAWLDFNCPPAWDPRKRFTTEPEIRQLLDDLPAMTAGKHQLFGYLTDCRLAAIPADKFRLYSSLVQNMRAVSARLYLLTDDEFQTASGATSVKYLSHDDPAVAEAYIRGQLAGVEKIKGDIIAAKDRARTYEQRRLGLTETTRSHDATLEVLREQARPPKTEQEAWMERFNDDGQAVEKRKVWDPATLTEYEVDDES